MSRRSSRRNFLKTTTAAAAGVGFWVAGGLEAAPLRQPGPNDRLNIGIIGAGGRGADNLSAVAKTENIVALCDVDAAHLGSAGAKHPDSKRFDDFRHVLDLKGLDGVVVATPDHNHAVIVVNAAFLAAEDGRPLNMRHLAQAARAEYRKLDRELRLNWPGPA